MKKSIALSLGLILIIITSFTFIERRTQKDETKDSPLKIFGDQGFKCGLWFNCL